MFWLFWPQGMWDLSLLTRDPPATPALEGEVLTIGPPGKSPKLLLDFFLLICLMSI